MNFILSSSGVRVCALLHFIYFPSGQAKLDFGWRALKIISLAGDRKFINKLTILLR